MPSIEKIKHDSFNDISLTKEWTLKFNFKVHSFYKIVKQMVVNTSLAPFSIAEGIIEKGSPRTSAGLEI